ncbi:hypothetical protein Droror1_Dr00025500 [Drosera rotundifolia]
MFSPIFPQKQQFHGTHSRSTLAFSLEPSNSINSIHSSEASSKYHEPLYSRTTSKWNLAPKNQYQCQLLQLIDSRRRSRSLCIPAVAPSHCVKPSCPQTATPPQIKLNNHSLVLILLQSKQPFGRSASRHLVHQRLASPPQLLLRSLNVPIGVDKSSNNILESVCFTSSPHNGTIMLGMESK